MRNLLTVCAGLLVLSTVVSAKLWRDLRSERQRTATLQTQLAELQNTSGTLAAQRAQVPAVPASSSTAAPALPSPGAVPIAPPSVTVTPAGNAIRMNPESELLKNPEYRKARLAQLRMNLGRTFPGLADELGLDASEADALFDLLAEHQLLGASRTAVSRSADPVEQQALQAEMRRIQEENQRVQNDALTALLGPARYAQWQRYQETRDARSRATTLGTSLASVGQPLSNAQLRPLIAAIHAEELRTRDVQQGLNREEPGNAQAMLRTFEEAMKVQEEGNRRILEAAAPHLTPQQLAALRARFQEQEETTRLSARVRQEQMRAREAAGRPY